MSDPPDSDPRVDIRARRFLKGMIILSHRNRYTMFQPEVFEIGRYIADKTDDDLDAEIAAIGIAKEK